MGYVQSDGCRLYYEEAGEGVPILLIHPAGSTARVVIAHEFPWRFARHVPNRSQVRALVKIASLALRGRENDAAETLLRAAYTYLDGRSAWDAFPPHWRQAARENAGATLADFRNSIGAYPSAAELATIAVPIVCSYGARSPQSMVRLVRSLAPAIPAAETRRIEGAGHAASFDAPSNFVELVAEAIEARGTRDLTTAGRWWSRSTSRTSCGGRSPSSS